MKKLFAAMAAMMLLQAHSQSHTISGYVEDADSKERLIGVNVYVAGTSMGTSTNTYGFYSLTLPEGQYNLVISFIGYRSIRRSVNVDKNIRLDLELRSDREQLEEVEISGGEAPAQKTQMSQVSLSVPEIKKIPAFMGEVDIIRAIQLLPGVQSGNEGSTGFYVRGGSPDQNLILLDGVPVYNASHLFGFFSVFNADAIKNVQITKGGFPARYGGRLSSVLEIDMKEGNMKEFHGRGSIGLISSKLTLEGPIVPEKTSFIISGRRTYYDLLIKPFLPDEFGYGYYFGDLSVKVNHIFSRKDRLYASYYTGLDRFSLVEREEGEFEDGSGTAYESENEANLRWGNNTGSIRWNHLFNDRLFSNLTATFTRYKFSTGYRDYYKDYSYDPPYVDDYGFEYSSMIEDYGLRYDFEYVHNIRHKFRFGASYTYHSFRPGVAQFQGELNQIEIDSLLNLSDPVFSHDFFAYAEDDWQISELWRATYGLHYSRYALKDASYQSLQPRLSTRYLLRDDWSIKASYAMMNQYIHLLSNTGIGLPTDLWVSSTANIQPQLSQQIALGSTKSLKGDRYEVSVEAYYKWMENLIEYKEGASFFTTSDWENNVETDGIGKAYGIEFLLRKNEGKTTGWIGYTLARSTRQFTNLNEGKQFPYKYDRRHDISLVVNHKFNDRFDAGLTWVYGSGNTFTAPLSRYHLVDFGFNTLSPSSYERYSDRNALRMPPYHRLDLSVSYHVETRWGQSTWNFSVYNAYSRQNPFFLMLDQDEQSGEPVVKQVSLFPIVPSISYIFEF